MTPTRAKTVVGQRAPDLEPVPADHEFGHHAADHDWRVVRDWHRPNGHENEWRLHRCGDGTTCDQGWIETRAPTGLEPETPEFDTIVDRRPDVSPAS